LKLPAHKTEGVNRTKTVRFYPFVLTGNDPRKGWRIPLNEIKYNEQRDALRLNPQSGGLCGARLTSPQDLLTGYGYLPRQARQAHHGARYMDHELMTMWLSVDPMADKYPGISPYAYCAWNPVKLVDPDGCEISLVFSSNGKYRGCTKEGYTGAIIIYDGNRDFKNMSSTQLESATKNDKNKAENYTYSNYRNTMSKNAKEKMYTHIASKMEGYVVQGADPRYPFSLKDLEGGKIFYKEEGEGAFISTTGRNRIIAIESNLIPLDMSCSSSGFGYEATVENIQASIVIHEWYGHLRRGWGDANNNHQLCYAAVYHDPLYRKTTESYKNFINRMYDYYKRKENNNKKKR